MKVILYESLEDIRTPEQITQIIGDTKVDLILRAAPRISINSLQGSHFDKLKTNISTIKSKYPNVKIIGNVYWQVIGRKERDDITEQTYTDQEVYDRLAFDPVKYNLSITKCEIQCHNDSCRCVPGGYGDVKYGIYYIPDISNPQVQTLLLHQAQKLFDAGCDGIWIDGSFINAYDIFRFGGSNADVQHLFDANLYLMKQIRNLTTLSRNRPMIATWYIAPEWMYFLHKSPYWYDKFFDFVTISAPYIDEIQQVRPTQDYDNIINHIKTNLGDIPIITYIDWWWDKHPMWYFSQWYPGWTFEECCNNHFKDRYNHQVNVLRYFTEFFKSKGIIWAYPIHCPSCQNSCTNNYGACCTKSYGTLYSYDALAPEFNTYPEIVRLMNTTKSEVYNMIIIISIIVIIGYLLKET